MGSRSCASWSYHVMSSCFQLAKDQHLGAFELNNQTKENLFQIDWWWNRKQMRWAILGWEAISLQLRESQLLTLTNLYHSNLKMINFKTTLLFFFVLCSGFILNFGRQHIRFNPTLGNKSCRFWVRSWIFTVKTDTLPQGNSYSPLDKSF